MQPKKHKKTNSRPKRAVLTVFVNCAHWRGSTLAIYKTVLIIFPLNLQTITITVDVVKWRWGGRLTRNDKQLCWMIQWKLSQQTSHDMRRQWGLAKQDCHSPNRKKSPKKLQTTYQINTHLVTFQQLTKINSTLNIGHTQWKQSE